ncbi:MAG: hypothetical protein ONB44_19700 [candidate division KSB1 bacterium]|nr:hypothetical protein [candidate division KSB1 bacterium]MDZ7304354.1 hypothetical protein [candidate division KSB1 bacterium]MDZ7313667.1 hypothetical protein [candidate division KSB1 bacterium]
MIEATSNSSRSGLITPTTSADQLPRQLNKDNRPAGIVSYFNTAIREDFVKKFLTVSFPLAKVLIFS